MYRALALLTAQSDLAPATTYYWKVRTMDNHGGVSESAVWSFTTR